jgi:peptidyl-tRNA hydrolase ICT1
MLRAIPPFLRHSTTRPSFWRSFASRRAELSSDDDLAAARKWLTKFNSTAIPRHVGEISFSRSGGPGGQNVNKSAPALNQIRAALAFVCTVSLLLMRGYWVSSNRVNSKATLKVPLDTLMPLVPRILHSPLQTSRYYAARTHSLVIQSEESRKQAANVDACFEKLHQLLRVTAKDLIPGETSVEQRERVHKLYLH